MVAKDPRQGVVEPSADHMLPSTTMFERLLAFFERGSAGEPESPGASPLQRAAAVLLAIAARLDGHMSADERASIAHVLRARLGVADAEALVEEAYAEAD